MCDDPAPSATPHLGILVKAQLRAAHNLHDVSTQLILFELEGDAGAPECSEDLLPGSPCHALEDPPIDGAPWAWIELVEIVGEEHVHLVTSKMDFECAVTPDGG